MTRNKYVVHLQEKLGLTRIEFAELIEMPVTNYHNIVNGIYVLGEKRFKKILDSVGAKIETTVTHENRKTKIDE